MQPSLLHDIDHVHLIGIGGCGMSGLASMLHHQGVRCSGSDHSPSAVTAQLQAMGIPVVHESTPQSLPEEARLVVVSAAIGEDHPERVAAAERGIPVIKYARMLGELMNQRTGLAVAGTHGKSSTTSMLCHIMLCADRDPSFIVGAHCEQIGGGSRSGTSDLLIVEACEYDRSFHHLHPTHAVILNVEADHLDCYRDLDEIVASFTTFARQVSPDGMLLINHEMSHRLPITADLRCDVQTIGFSAQADWQVQFTRQQAILRRGDEVVMRWQPRLPGEHMAYNASAAGILAHACGVDWPTIQEAVASFQGLNRRTQRLGHVQVAGGTATIIDDYGHHPTEVDTTLRALRQHEQPQRLICVFQPHQHSRTRFLMKQFAVSFQAADIVIVPDIYFVRDSEQERQAVTAADLVDHLRRQQVQAMHLYPFEAIVEQLRLIMQPGDLVVTMGAGDVWQIGKALVEPQPL